MGRAKRRITIVIEVETSHTLYDQMRIIRRNIEYLFWDTKIISIKNDPIEEKKEVNENVPSKVSDGSGNQAQT